MASAARRRLWALAATVAQQSLISNDLSDFFEDARLGGSKCDGTCPAVAPRDWHKMSDKGSAHLLIFGDSTDKLWHKAFCNELLSEEQRCGSPDECATPSPAFLPNNMQPFVCVDGDDRCAAGTCYESPSAHCWKKEEHRAAAACKAPVAQGPALGFVHIFGADPEYVQDMKAIHNQYAVKGLPVKIADRVRVAARLFLSGAFADRMATQQRTGQVDTRGVAVKGAERVERGAVRVVRGGLLVRPERGDVPPRRDARVGDGQAAAPRLAREARAERGAPRAPVRPVPRRMAMAGHLVSPSSATRSRKRLSSSPDQRGLERSVIIGAGASSAAMAACGRRPRFFFGADGEGKRRPPESLLRTPSRYAIHFGTEFSEFVHVYLSPMISLIDGRDCGG